MHEESQVCDVCLDPYTYSECESVIKGKKKKGNEDKLIFCDGCNAVSHQSCYGSTWYDDGFLYRRYCLQGSENEDDLDIQDKDQSNNNGKLNKRKQHTSITSQSSVVDGETGNPKLPRNNGGKDHQKTKTPKVLLGDGPWLCQRCLTIFDK